ncbi:hypothetical protein CKF54_06275 [Psittacicella hinzii]|uniref:Beta-ketoacyl synthase-like N-terminal domain-containing protein n=1 Tax=Psittacicella hinzii TaxID=2028575 RepID=A0A3A1Y2H2_9GAMM|nr:beta-ketoacyl synthase chain length factor [Psittacicella hinzii]RIY31641.1 hypothetical protein CKF54_06275 [Psittacicella hinzii]
MNVICKFNFSIESWNFALNREVAEHEWKEEASYWYEQIQTRESIKPKLDFLPLAQRRRLNNEARLMFEAAWDLTNQEDNYPVIYASLRSEINRSLELIQSLVTEGSISPTSFGLSVHNALIGQWSILKKVTQESTAISSLYENLEVSLLKAYTLLQEGHKKVVILLVEGELSSKFDYREQDLQLPLSYALALVVVPGNDYTLTMVEEATLPQPPFIDSNLLFIKSQKLGLQSWDSYAQERSWKWCKN